MNSLETGDGLAMARPFRLAEAGFALAADQGPSDSDLHDALGGRGMPLTAFFDRHGVLVNVVLGSVGERDLQSRVAQLRTRG